MPMLIPITRSESRVFNVIFPSFEESQGVTEFRVVDTLSGDTLDIKISQQNNAIDNIQRLADFLKAKIIKGSGGTLFHEEWTDENYPHEVVLKISERYFIHVHLVGDYIRFTEDRTTETFYWNSDEFSEDPGCVWGAVFGALIKYMPAADSIEVIDALPISCEQKGVLILHAEITRLQDTFGDEHPKYDLNEWRRCVDNFETTNGYWHWLYSTLESEKLEHEDNFNSTVLD